MTIAYVLLGPEHEGHSVALDRYGFTWEADEAIETRRATCSCGARVVVEIRTDSPRRPS